ncbi:tRNA (mnm(5)s(2)U34)-methyltransferase [[Clostridium] polysaccharolyticum]|uniref:Putative rRNA methylase n=1 Tax=[Clostridium] polysaccharolyticum TaxID=29364 RepID=A0A1H9ZV80_9FIRM|nr:class I SAM-dependent methyltransferase [[Clostridium] polysaccharolyticum]SES85689.1 Putative rRNA methylase [[Clostridium] polysaccharolyticum]
MKRYTITEYTQDVFRKWLKEDGLYIDATVGNGHDTEFLCKGVESGKVIGFDVQQLAIDHTAKRLEKAGIRARCQLVLDGHEHLMKYVEPESVDGIMFNFGYLPGGDHQCATRKETSIKAIEEGLRALKPGGILSMCIYSGQDTGFEEKDGILEYLKEVDQKKFVIIKSEFYNRPNNPPVPVFVIKQ